MMRSFLSRALSNREKCLLLVLIALLLVGLYFFAVQYPIAERTGAIAQENEALDTELAAARARADEYNAMKRSWRCRRTRSRCCRPTPTWKR